MIWLDVGTILGACSDFQVIVRGQGGHAAMPHTTVDPVVAGAAIVTALQVCAELELEHCSESSAASYGVTAFQLHIDMANGRIHSQLAAIRSLGTVTQHMVTTLDLSGSSPWLRVYHASRFSAMLLRLAPVLQKVCLTAFDVVIKQQSGLLLSRTGVHVFAHVLHALLRAEYDLIVCSPLVGPKDTKINA